MQTSGPGLEELAASAAAGSETALAELLTTIRPQVLRLCGRFLPCREDAEEACQDTLLAVAQRLGDFEGRSTFSTWLYRIAANRSRSTYQALRRRAVDAGAQLPPEPVDPRRTSVVAGTRIDLLEGLNALGPELAECVALRDVLELPYQEIAVLMGIPLGTVRSRIHEGRRRLREHLAG